MPKYYLKVNNASNKCLFLSLLRRITTKYINIAGETTSRLLTIDEYWFSHTSSDNSEDEYKPAT